MKYINHASNCMYPVKRIKIPRKDEYDKERS